MISNVRDECFCPAVSKPASDQAPVFTLSGASNIQSVECASITIRSGRRASQERFSCIDSVSYTRTTPSFLTATNSSVSVAHSPRIFSEASSEVSAMGLKLSLIVSPLPPLPPANGAPLRTSLRKRREMPCHRSPLAGQVAASTRPPFSFSTCCAIKRYFALAVTASPPP